jgi:hypothetical protein
MPKNTITIDNVRLSKILRENLDIILKENTVRDKVFISYGTDKFDLSKIKPVKVDSVWGQIHNKPEGGLWASPVGSNFGWADFCNRDAFHLKTLNKHFIFKLKSNAKICIIDTIDDLIKHSCFNKYIEQYVLDIRNIVKEYDGIYLTYNAATKLRYGDDERRIRGVDSWDVESICIFNPEVIEVIDENAFERAVHHKYEKPLYNPDEEEYYWGFDELDDRKKLQMDADFERYRNTNVEDNRELFNGKHPALLAQKHGNNKDAKLARKFNGTIKSGL